jgi:hypothetical protein
MTHFSSKFRLRLYVLSFSALVLILSSISSYAYFPFITDDTGTQGEGGNQLELNYLFVKERGVGLADDGTYSPGDYGTSNSFPITYTRGLTDDLDLFVGIIRQTSPTNGWMNSAIGFKWRFAGDAEEGWSFAVKPALLTPVSRSMEASGLGNGKTNGTVSLISSYIQPKYEVHLNARYTSNFSYSGLEEQQAQHLWGISVAPVWVVSPQWKLGVDAGLDTNPNATSAQVAYAQIGAVYAPIKNLQLGLGLMGNRALGSPSREYNWTVMSGVTWQF